MSPFLFIFPGVYLFYSRLKSNVERVSWILINPLMIGILSLAVSDLSPINFFLFYIVSFLIWQSVYEVGYLENDLITTKKEKNPTIRLEAPLHQLTSYHYHAIVAGKLIVASLLLVFLYFISLVTYSDINLIFFIILVFLARLDFYLHNKVRSRLNIVTFFVLSALKYLTVPFLFYSGENPVDFIVVIVFLFPFLRTLEHSCKSKYKFEGLSNLLGDFDRLRVKYYLFFLFSFSILSLFLDSDEIIIGIVFFGYFLFLRVLALFVASKINRRRWPVYPLHSSKKSADD